MSIDRGLRSWVGALPEDVLFCSEEDGVDSRVSPRHASVFFSVHLGHSLPVRAIQHVTMLLVSNGAVARSACQLVSPCPAALKKVHV